MADSTNKKPVRAPAKRTHIPADIRALQGSGTHIANAIANHCAQLRHYNKNGR